MMIVMMRHRLLLDVGSKHAAVPGIVLLIVGRSGARLPVRHVAGYGLGDYEQISISFGAKRESGTGAAPCTGVEALALSTLDRGTVKLNKTTIKVRAKQKPRTAHRRTFTHIHRRSHAAVGVLVCGGCSFLAVFISFFCSLLFSFFVRSSRMCEKKTLLKAGQ